MLAKKRVTIAVLIASWLVMLLFPVYTTDTAKETVDVCYAQINETAIKLPENIKQFFEKFEANNKTANIQHHIIKYIRTSVQKTDCMVLVHRIADIITLGLIIITYIFCIDGKKRYNIINSINTF